MKQFEQNIISIYGIKGKDWLNSLPYIISKIAEQHNLTGLENVKNMSSNYVANGYQNNTPIILKIGMNSKDLARESLGLKAFSDTAVEVITAEDNMIIMQRALPGTTLRENFTVDDKRATIIICSAIKKLHLAAIPKNHNFDNIADILKILDRELNIPDEILSKARKLRDDLLHSTKQQVLLHGDLHHDNILKNGDDWVVIDPKTFIGDPAFEPAAYLCNPIPELLQESGAREIIEKHIKTFSKQLDISEKRISDWLYVKSVLCCAWSLDDKLDPSYWKKFIEIIWI